MPIWTITNGRPVEVPQTSLGEEGLLEKDLEDWIMADPSILGEPLLLLGRQVAIPDIGDKLDILALDPQGNAVVVELKRGKLTDPADMQALRYASYVSKWGFDDFAAQARVKLDRLSDPDFNFVEIFEKFCDDANVDEVPDLNSDQRVILVGSGIREKLGSVALWLRDHSVDIKVIEVEAFRQGDDVFVHPQVIVPLPVSPFQRTGTGPGATGSKIWLSDGMDWHLEKRCSPQTREMLLRLDDLIRDNFDVDGPRWNQKLYVAYRIRNYNWLAIHTHTSVLRLDFLVRPGAFDRSELARLLNVQEFDREGSYVEKLELPSSVLIHKKSEDTEKVILRIKEDFNLDSEAFLAFLNQAYEAFPK